MDNRAYITRLAKNTDSTVKDSAALAAALADLIAESLTETDNVAIPGFGTFESTKTLEYIAEDPATGLTMLYPPKISVSFKPGSRLKKAVANK